MAHAHCKKKKTPKITNQILKDFFDTEQITVFCLGNGIEKRSVEFLKDLIIEDNSTIKSLIVKIVNSKKKTPIYLDEETIKKQSNFDEIEIRLSIDDVPDFFENHEFNSLKKNYRKIYFVFTSQDFFNGTEVDDYFKNSLFIFDKKKIKKEQLLYIKEMKENHKLENISIILMKNRGDNR